MSLSFIVYGWTIKRFCVIEHSNRLEHAFANQKHPMVVMRCIISKTILFDYPHCLPLLLFGTIDSLGMCVNQIAFNWLVNFVCDIRGCIGKPDDSVRNKSKGDQIDATQIRFYFPIRYRFVEKKKKSVKRDYCLDYPISIGLLSIYW